MENENLKTLLHNFQKQLVIVPINKTASKFSFIYKKIISRIYNGIGVYGTLNSTYEFSSKTKDNVWNNLWKHFFFNKFGSDVD